MSINAREYYSKGLVKKEITEYCRNRWVATLVKSKGKLIFIRYWRDTKKPLSFSSIIDFDKFIKQTKWATPRTFYATANLFKDLSDESLLEDKNNIYASTPVWDIDAALRFWRKSLDVAKAIIDSLEKEGVIKSVYLLWSGRGVHIHIHELAISAQLREKHNPLDISYSIVDYILRKTRDKILSIAKEAKDPERPLKVENEMDAKRVFTVPLSLHKSVNYAAVVFKPDEIEDFELDWANPNKPKHNPNWRKYEEGEADELAIKALKEVGGYFNRVGEIRTVIGFEKPRKISERKESTPVTRKGGRIGRFQVMALLQAARYFILKGDLDKAKSFGLNRAIFYAWAKHYKVGRKKKGTEITGEKGELRFESIGTEQAPVSPRGFFVMGDQEQKPEDFDKEIADKIEQTIPFKLAWEAALKYLKRFPTKVLLDQQEFFKKVYEPVKDDFIDRVVIGKKKDKTLFDFMS